MVEIDLHSHGPERLDEMGLLGQHEAGLARLKDDLGGRVEHLVSQSAVEHPDDGPHARLGAVLPAKARRQSALVEYRGALVGHRRG